MNSGSESEKRSGEQSLDGFSGNDLEVRGESGTTPAEMASRLDLLLGEFSVQSAKEIAENPAALEAIRAELTAILISGTSPAEVRRTIQE